jgi:hypothetical protein
LIAECRQLGEASIKDKKEFWSPSDPLPPTIKSLSPQVVQFLEQETAKVADIQISGGFKHKGLLVVWQSGDPNFIPRKGRNWRITKIAAGVFEYEE